MPLGTNDTLLLMGQFDSDPGGGGGNLTMRCVFYYLTNQPESGFSCWLPLGSFSKSKKPSSLPLPTRSCSDSSWRR